MHQRQWVCNACSSTLSNRQDFVNHLREVHSDHVLEHQIPVVAEISERVIDEDTILQCSLCPDELFLARLREHTAEHLEELALFVLPMQSGEEDDADSNIAMAVELEVAGSTGGTSISKFSSNRSVQSGPPESPDEAESISQAIQQPRDFAGLSTQEDPSVTQKLEMWRDEDTNSVEATTLQPSLARQAQDAEGDAAALQEICDLIGYPENIDIQPCINLLRTVGSGLRELDDKISIHFARSSDIPAQISADINLLLRSLERTHQDLSSRFISQRAQYRRLWDDLESSLGKQRGSMSLHLSAYKTFISHILECIIDG